MLGGQYFKRRASQKYYRVKIRFGDHERILRAAVDTGNALTDPISGLPAAAVRIDALCGVLPQTICDSVRKSPIGAFYTLPDAYRARARLLPVETVTGGGMLLAFRADEFCISPEEGEKRAWEERSVLIALTASTTEDAEVLLPAGI